jgi:hypothetical protein
MQAKINLTGVDITSFFLVRGIRGEFALNESGGLSDA